MRKNIARVIEAFKHGHTVTGDSKGTCSTDKHVIYSYAMKIAARHGGRIYIVKYDAGPSRTTKSHIHACQVALHSYNYIEVDKIAFDANEVPELQKVIERTIIKEAPKPKNPLSLWE